MGGQITGAPYSSPSSTGAASLSVAGSDSFSSGRYEAASNAAAEGFELLFFPQLRQELKRQLDQSPNILRFHGLRDCVKQLAGTARWNRRCQNLDDQIVEYLRGCWETECASQFCALLVL